MCFSQKTQTPATPPPAPPVLEQSAPDTATPTTSDQLKNRAAGAKRYRSTMSIGTPQNAGTQSNGLSIGV
jgi:hypothetical protein